MRLPVYLQVAALVVLALGLWIWVPGSDRVLGFRPEDVAVGVGALAVGEALSLGFAAVLERAPDVKARVFDGAGAVRLTPLAPIAAAALGVCEELFFRGYFLASVFDPEPARLHLEIPYWLTVVLIGGISSLVFGLGHVKPGAGRRGNALLFALSAAAGLTYFAAAFLTASVWTAVIAHGTYNLVELRVSVWRDRTVAGETI